jgi:hypothetical protein
LIQWTPNIGLGGNHAIETTALLANILRRLACKSPDRSYKTIQIELEKIQKRRMPRVLVAYDKSNLATRMDALSSRLNSFLILHFFPRLDDWTTSQVALGTIGAEKLDYLPEPQRALQSFAAFNQEIAGPGTSDHTKSRIATTLPLFFLAYCARMIFSNIITQPGFQKQVGDILSSGHINISGDCVKLPTNISVVDLLVSGFSPAILGVNAVHRLQSITFLTDLAPVWLIFVLEAHRRANSLKVLTLPPIFGLAFQMYGIGVVGPIWFAIHYIQSPLSHYAAKDWRMINVGAVKTAAMSILLTLTIPTMAMFTLPDASQRLTTNALWQIFPLTSVALHYALRTWVVQDTTPHDKIYDIEADMPYTRTAVWLYASISAVVFNMVRWSSRATTEAIFFPALDLLKSIMWCPEKLHLDLVSGIKLFLQVDEIVCFAAAFLWLLYLIRDLKAAEMTVIPWWKVLAAASLGTLAIGPGAVVALAWWWRENVLATEWARGSAGRKTAKDRLRG